MYCQWIRLVVTKMRTPSRNIRPFSALERATLSRNYATKR
jgi:hypothetical protein